MPLLQPAQTHQILPEETNGQIIISGRYVQALQVGTPAGQKVIRWSEVGEDGYY